MVLAMKVLEVVDFQLENLECNLSSLLNSNVEVGIHTTSQ